MLNDNMKKGESRKGREDTRENRSGKDGQTGKIAIHIEDSVGGDG